MTYEETIEYLYNQTPMFERQGATGYKEGLQNTISFDKHFNHPHKSFKTIHVAGTNGKGSCSHTIAALLQLAGFKVGLYTSPHLIDFRERIRVNGICIEKEYVVNFVKEEREFIEQLHPSFFEVTTAMAFKYFKDSNVDIAVVEVGLGGRLDCTNIITPLLSIITNISFDHTQFLGNTLSKIANEKAGIIKDGIPVVIGESNTETTSVFDNKAKECGSKIIYAEKHPEVITAEQNERGIIYQTKSWGVITGKLTGDYQRKNTNTILTAINVLGDLGLFSHISEADLKVIVGKAFENVTQLTGLMGRWQIVCNNPLTICDTGHNEAGWKYISQQLKSINCTHLHIVFGMVDDKDIDNVMAMLPKKATYYFTQADNKRSLSSKTLHEMAIRNNLNGSYFKNVSSAYKKAEMAAGPDDAIFVGGSTYVVADFLKESH